LPSSCCSPAARASATAFSGLNPPGAQLQDGSCSFAERVFCRASAICPRRASRPTKTLLRYDPGLPANTMKVPCPAIAAHGAHYCNSSFNMASTVEEIPPFSLKPWKTQGRRFSAPLFGAPPAGHMPHKAHQIRICYKTLNCVARMYFERELTAWMKQRTALSALRLVEAQAANA